jgi:hypothetical protein
MHKWVFWTAALAGVATAPTPVVEARGVVNGVTFELAPSTAAASVPLPTSLGSPAVEVLVNGRPAPLYFVSPGQINAQAPWETEPGSAQVVVRRSGRRAARPDCWSSSWSLRCSLLAAGFGPATLSGQPTGDWPARTTSPARATSWCCLAAAWERWSRRSGAEQPDHRNPWPACRGRSPVRGPSARVRWPVPN